MTNANESQLNADSSGSNTFNPRSESNSNREQLREKVINYPPPKTTERDARSIDYDDEIARRNSAKALNLKLPLLEKEDKYGVPYTNISQLLKETGYSSMGIKDYKFAEERTEVFENNNSGGKSKRFDFRKCFMPQFEATIKLNNESNDSGDETSLKDGGPHSDPIRNQADCFIVQLKNDGKSACTQLEPSHMDDDPHGYGDKFNKVSLDLPALKRNKYSIRYLRFNDVPNKRVVVFVAIQIPSSDEFKDWTVVYETVVNDGMGGRRGLKDPYRQWVHSALEKRDSCSVTIRMDEQPQTEIEKGVTYDNARITEIVDYEAISTP